MPHDPETIRRFADGELDDHRDPDAAARAESLERAAADDAQLAGRVQGEKDLRAAVGRVMGTTSAPDKLREAVTAALSSEPSRASGHTESTPEPAPDAEGRRSFWAGPARANVFAVAASLLLVAGAILFGIFGQPIGTVDPADVAEARLEELAVFAAATHHDAVHRLLGSPGSSVAASIDDARIALAGVVGALPTLADLDADGYQYLGALAGSFDHSTIGQVIYRRGARAEDGCPASFAGCCILADSTGDLAALMPPIEADRWLEIAVPSGGSVSCATDGRFVYVVLCCNDSETPELARRFALAAARRDESHD